MRHLRAFVAVAEELHFGRAARRLYVAQPAVSQLVRGLEAELGVTLLERTSRRVSLTWAGRVLLEEARDLLDREALLVDRMRRICAGETGEVGLGTIPALPPDLIPGLLTAFRVRLPDVTVVARSLAPGLTAAAALDQPDVDIALLRGEVTEAGISTAEVARERVGVALPAADPLAARASLVATDLEGRAFVAFPRVSDRWSLTGCSGHSVPAGFAHTSSTSPPRVASTHRCAWWHRASQCRSSLRARFAPIATPQLSGAPSTLRS